MVRTFSWILLCFAIVNASQEDSPLDVFAESSEIFGDINGQNLRGPNRRALDGTCTCNNPDYPCQNSQGGCWPLPTKEGCEVRNNGLLCEAQPCTLKGCEKCTLDGKTCVKCKENHMPVTSQSCASFDELFSDVSDSSFTLSGNLVLFSSEKIAQALSDGFAMVEGKPRDAAVKQAIAAFARHFKDEFDAVAVFPSTKLSGYTTSTHFSLKPDYTGAPKKLRSGIIHNMWTGYSTIPFKHELLHRFGVFNKLVPKKLGKTYSVFSHWGLTAVGNARGQLGGWARSAVECTNGQKPDKTNGCPDGKLRFPADQGDPGASNDGNPMSEFELLMAGLINPDQVSGDLIVCDAQSSSIDKGGEVVTENGKTYIIGDCASGINFVSPAELEANWQLSDKDNVRLQPRGKSDPNLRVVALVVYKSDADVAEVCACM